MSECDQKIQDLMHLAELHNDMNVCEGYKVYRKLADVRRERRKVKNENELITPIYEFMTQNPRLSKDVSVLLGKCRAAKDAIDKRVYTARTDII